MRSPALAIENMQCGAMMAHQAYRGLGASGTVEAAAFLTRVFKSVRDVDLIGSGGAQGQRCRSALSLTVILHCHCSTLLWTATA